MAERIPQQQGPRHKVIDYFELGEFIRDHSDEESSERQRLIDARAKDFQINPTQANIRRAKKYYFRFSRNIIQKLLDLSVGDGGHTLSLAQLDLLAGLDNDVAMEEMTKVAVQHGMDRKQFRDHIYHTLGDTKCRRPGGGRSRRKFASPLTALPFCRDRLKALNSALDDIEPKLSTGEQRRLCKALKKAFETASTALTPLAKSCDVELEDPPYRPRKSKASKYHEVGLEEF